MLQPTPPASRSAPTAATSSTSAIAASELGYALARFRWNKPSTACKRECKTSTSSWRAAPTRGPRSLTALLYLAQSRDKHSLQAIQVHVRALLPYIGHLEPRQVHDETL